MMRVLRAIAWLVRLDGIVVLAMAAALFAGGLLLLFLAELAAG